MRPLSFFITKKSKIYVLWTIFVSFLLFFIAIVYFDENGVKNRAVVVIDGTSKGIVMCSSEKMIKNTYAAARDIRSYWKSSLPITIVHCDELSTSSVRMMSTIPSLFIVNICNYPQTRTFKKKLRSFYCKAAALYSSPYEDTMLIDVDVIWFKNPDNLFDSPGYLQTGALYFRDRFVKQLKKGQKRDGLFQGEVEQLIINERNKRLPDQPINGFLQNNNNFTLFWRHSQNNSEPALQHIQESSVVLLRKSNHLNTLHVIRDLLPTFQQGYGDKEIYWISTTIANEPFAWEPYLFGIYGECGAVIHFDPTLSGINIDSKNINKDNRKIDTSNVVYFMNAEYLLEKAKFAGDKLQPIISRLILVNGYTPLFDMGASYKKTGGRCGACKFMGCMPTPPIVNETIARIQKIRLNSNLY